MKTMFLAGSAAIALAEAGAVPAMAAETIAIAAAQATAAVPNNALLADWTGPYDGVPPWDKVKPGLFPQAFQYGIDEQRREILAIADSTEAPTFANTIEAIEKTGQRLDRVGTLF